MDIRLPRLYKLVALLPVSILLGLVGYRQVAKFSIILTVITIVIKVTQLIKQRYANHKIFVRGNIPTIGSINPITGNNLQVIEPKDNIKILHDYHKKLGKNYGIFYGPDPWVLSTDLDLLQKLFVTDGDRHINMPDLRTPYYTEFIRSLFQLKDNDWRSHRRAFNPLFAPKQVKMDNVSKDIEDTCNKLLDLIGGHKLELDSSGNNKGYTVDLDNIFKKYSIEISLKFVFGSDRGANMEPYRKDEIAALIRASMHQVVSPVLISSVIFNGLECLFRFLVKFSGINRQFTRLHEILDNISRSRRARIEASKSNGTALEGPKRVVDVIHEMADRGLIDNDTIKAHLFFFLVSSFETTANTLIWMCWLLARHQDIQEKLRQGLLTEGESSTYLDWVMKETLRLYPAVPAGIGRVVGEDIQTPQGQTIFKGTTVLASIYSIHRSEEYWGQDVDQFRPERFAEPLSHPLQYFAFGCGPRNCIGMNLAKAEMRAIVTRILLKYRIEPCATTPSQINYTSPLLVSMVLDIPIDVKFLELNH